MVRRPDIAAGGLKFCAAAWNRRLPCRSATAARTSATSASIPVSSTMRRPWNSRTSLGGDEMATEPSASYFHGMPPLATTVPTPDGV